MNKKVLKIALFGAIMAVTVDYLYAPTLRKTVGLK
jgi:hypothetical protein